MTYRDEFDEPPRGNNGFLSRVGPKAAFFVVLIALSFMIGVVWKLYVGARDDVGQNVPIVRADESPFKVAPDDPGGMEIPHKDSTIFSSLNSDEEGKIENLLAEDDNEEPMPRSQLFAGLNTESNVNLDSNDQSSPLDQPVGDVAQQIGQDMDIPEVEEPVLADTEEENDSVIEIAPKIEIPEAEVPKKVDPVVKSVETPKPEPVKAAPAPETTSSTSTSSGDYVVQLASVKTADGAESEWKKLVSKYGSTLSGYSHVVEKADLGNKGVFYRIQAGPVSKDKATATCDAIKKITPGGCLVKKK